MKKHERDRIYEYNIIVRIVWQNSAYIRWWVHSVEHYYVSTIHNAAWQEVKLPYKDRERESVIKKIGTPISLKQCNM